MEVLVKAIMTSVKKAVTYNHSNLPIDCLFCRIHKRIEPGTIVLENEEFVVFKTISPASHTHLLITPREHIQNLDALGGKEDSELLERMVLFGRESIGDFANDAQYCFHVPPYNSIDHLHLHAIAEPHKMSFFNGLKYKVGSWWCQSASDIIDDIRSKPSVSRTKVFL